MNIALNTILILLALLPGLTFRSSYLSVRFAKNLVHRDKASELFKSVVPSILIHAIGYWWFQENIDLDYVFKLVAKPMKLRALTL